MRESLAIRFAFAAGLLISSPMISRAHAGENCNQTNVTLVAAYEDENDICAAFVEVVNHFTAGGLRADVKLTIRFQPSVYMDLSSGATRDEVIMVPVRGRFHRARNEVQVIASAAAPKFARKPLGLPWSAAIGRSILQHEIAHAVVAKLLGERYDKLPRAWHEALAYAVQIDLMPPELRANVLANYPAAQAFDMTTKINDFTYGFDPDAFAVRVYRTYAERGRMEFVRKALAFELEMIDLRDLFN